MLATGVGRNGAVSSARDFQMEKNAMGIQSIWFSNAEYFLEGKSVMKSQTLTNGMKLLFIVCMKTKADKLV